MRKITAAIILTCICLTAVRSQSLKPTVQNTGSGLLKQTDNWQFFDGNNIKCTINRHGPFADYQRTNSAGFFWPKESSKTAIYTAGIWIAGIHRPAGEIRCAVQDYQTEYQAGTINGVYNTATNSTGVLSNPLSEKFRVYKINNGDSLSNDYREWPADLGAPYIDVNKNGSWDSNIDTPALTGSQTLWSVYNDGNPANHANVSLSKPMGLEVQATYFGFNNVRFLRDVMFLKWKIINKSDAIYDSTFFGLWHDADLGENYDDCQGVDTIRNMMYVYNGDDSDAVGSKHGYGVFPPALGFVFLQTPIMPSSGGDSAKISDVWIQGKRNIGPSSFVPIIEQLWGWPPLRSQDYITILFNRLKGLLVNGSSMIDPTTNRPSKFAFPGDPVTDSGWTQNKSLIGPDDVRGVFSSGPFTFAPGDTQEVVAAIVLAQGKDRLKSITDLRLRADLVKEFFNYNYRLYQIDEPPPPTIPAPQNFVLQQNYPNPFNPSTTISYSVPDLNGPYPVRLKIYDVLGKEVAVLVNEIKSAGTYHVEWHAGRTMSGVYFYSLSIGGTAEIKKMMLLR